MYILRTFPTTPRLRRLLLVAINYFMKWVEAEPLTNITVQVVQKFFWRNIITRFGIPNTLIIDNGIQFTDRKLNEFLRGHGI